MICDICDVAMKSRIATREDPYAFTMVGLPNVQLVGLRAHRCPRCLGDIAEIPRMQELHRVIAAMVVRKSGLLTGAEIRYLRIHAELPAKDFARLLRVSPSTLSRVESDKQAFSESLDQMVRLISTVIAQDGESARQVLLATAEGRKRKRRTQPRLFKVRRGHWEEVANAAA